MDKISFAPAGDQGIVITFSDEISEAVNRKIYSVVNQINNEKIKGVYEVIPSYISLLVLYDRHLVTYSKLMNRLEKIVSTTDENSLAKCRIHHIPVCYEEEFALDLQDVSEHCKLSPKEIVDIHTSTDYLIYMLGFLPGFAYLGGLDERISCPRLSTPRTKIPAGGVGIGGSQTGIYPLESPGGWRIIGKTPVKVYDPNREPSILYMMGERIRFEAITMEEFKSISKSIDEGKYSHQITEVEYE